MFQSPLLLQAAPFPSTPCANKTERGVVFDFLGYQPQPDGTTRLAFRITNPQQRALDAIGFTSNGWQRVAPTAGSPYAGAVGAYEVRWVLDEGMPRQAGFRFRPQGAWFQNGASETFVLTVRTFDPTRVLVVWARANLQLAMLQGRPADHPCLIYPHCHPNQHGDRHTHVHRYANSNVHRHRGADGDGAVASYSLTDLATGQYKVCTTASFI